MKSMIRRLAVACLISGALLLQGCASQSAQDQELAVGKANFAIQNYPLAFKRLLPLAQKGNPDAEYAVGYMYYYGYGTTRDDKQAVAWIEKAAAQDHQKAKEALAMMHRAESNPFYAPKKS